MEMIRGEGGGKALPKWMKYHAKVAYIVFAADMLFAFGYLTYVGIILGDRRMYLPHEFAMKWLDLNSYSLMPPFFAIPVAPLLAWHVKQNHEISEGDFYGIIGSMLGLGAISLFDSVKAMQIYSGNDFQTNTSSPAVLRDAMQQGVGGNTYMDWTYKLEARHKNKVVSLVYEHGVDGYRIPANTSNDTAIFLANPDNRSVPAGGVWKMPHVADRGIRIWTHLIQKQFKCCGAESYTEWEDFMGNIYADSRAEMNKRMYGIYPPSCYCEYPDCSKVLNHEDCWRGRCKRSNDSQSLAILKKRPGCLKFYKEYIHQVYLVTFVLMLIMGLLYVMSIGVCIVNFAAIRARVSTNLMDDMRTYSLLRESGLLGHSPTHNK